MYVHIVFTYLSTHSLGIFHVLLFFTLFITQGTQMRLRAFTATWAYGIGYRQVFPLRNMFAGLLPLST